jgi:hypothetical protein
MMNLDTRIQIHQGHAFPVAVDPDWTGTVDEFWAANQDMTYGDIRDMLDDLRDCGYHHIGGGAQGCFTVLTPASATANKADASKATA